MNNQEVKRVWIDDYKVHSYEVDCKGNATLPMLCKYMQESAWHHAENLGVGFSHLSKDGLFWVLSQQFIRIDNIPKWGETVFVHTWPSGKDRLVYIRDFKIINQKQEVVCMARTKWFALDLKRRRPQNVDSYFNYDLTGAEQVFSHELTKLEPVQTDQSIKSVQVESCDLDVNEHVNNVKYIEWILESFPLEFYKEKEIKEFEINYLAEAFYGNQLIVSSEKKDEGNYNHKIIRKEEPKELCRARTFWE
jgi:acyl-ACP thioesterase